MSFTFECFYGVTDTDKKNRFQTASYKNILDLQLILYWEMFSYLMGDRLCLTGGGDNFNAGYCFARLNGFDLFESLMVANAVSGYYVKFGNSPDVDNFIGFLRGVDLFQ
jgi:hypothetical protein